MPEPPVAAPRAAWAAPRATALALLAIGVIALVATFAVPAGAESPWAPSGTRFFPLAVSIGLILFSLAFLARVTVWPDTELGAHAAEEAAETDWIVPALVAAGLIGYVALIEPLGYVVASTLFFPFGARVLGSRSLLRDVVAGAALARGRLLPVHALARGAAASRAAGGLAMEVLGDLLNGFGAVLEPQNLLLAALGVTLGTLVGVLPGIGPALTIALLMPLTFNFSDPTGAFIMFAGIYAGGMYGGSTTSILLNTPGESSSVATAIEGFQMAKRGRARSALATAAIGSFVAGTIGIVLLTLVARPMADLAVRFQPADYFALTVLAFASVTALVGKSLVRGFGSLFLGLLIGCIGIDQVSGQSRLSLGLDPARQRHPHRARGRRALRGRRGAPRGSEASPHGRGRGALAR